MKITKSQRNNIITLLLIILFIVPQTRKPIQVTFHKVLMLFSPSVIDKEDRVSIKNYGWNLVDQNGNKYDFNEAKNEVVFVNLWATWCPPCIAEMPAMQNLYNDYKNRVTFLFVTNEDFKRVQAFFNKKEYTLPTFQSISEIPSELYSRSIPATYILDKKGEIVVNKKGAADWNGDAIRSLLDTLLLE